MQVAVQLVAEAAALLAQVPRTSSLRLLAVSRQQEEAPTHLWHLPRACTMGTPDLRRTLITITCRSQWLPLPRIQRDGIARVAQSSITACPTASAAAATAGPRWMPEQPLLACLNGASFLLL